MRKRRRRRRLYSFGHGYRRLLLLLLPITYISVWFFRPMILLPLPQTGRSISQ
jgi:hypothetical protein